MKLTVRTAGGSHCEIMSCGHWTYHDLSEEIHRQLGIPVAQQRLIYGGKLLNPVMFTTVSHQLSLAGGQDVSLELLLYVRSAAVAEALEVVTGNDRKLRDVS